MPPGRSASAWRFGWTLVPAGDSRRAVDVLRASMRLDPFHGPLPLFFLGVAHFMLREYAQALTIARDFVAQAPVRPWGHALVAMIHAEMGAFEEAPAEAAEVLRLDSAFTVSGTAGSLAAFKESKDHEHFFGALIDHGFIHSADRYQGLMDDCASSEHPSERHQPSACHGGTLQARLRARSATRRANRDSEQ
jgi:tetratricopeptide (TPR) repeat protein